MTNDTNTLNGALTELGETMATNLVAKGVTNASASDGLTTLAGKILNISTSGGGGLSCTTSISCTSSSASVEVGNSVTLSATLSVSYDDTSQTNVDLTGVLTGATVKFYNGNTLLGTGTTNSNGVATYTYTSNTASTLSIHSTFEGTTEFGTCTSSNISVTVYAPSTNLSINVPLNLVYSDEFNITGILSDNNSNGINGATVYLKVGNTIVDSVTTISYNGTDGLVEFEQTPVATGDHTFQLVFDGDSTHGAVNSQTVTRTVGKETSVISVDYPLNNASIYSDGSVGIYGILYDDDGDIVTSKNIVVSENGTTLTTLTTDSDGEFDGMISGLSVGSHDLTFAFVTDSYYTGSSVTRTVIVNSPSLSVTGTKSILSHASNESTTITATYTGASVSGKSVVFKKGGTTLDTVSTDSNGQASYTYSSTGAGDVTITVECMNLQETFVVEDCVRYDDASTDKTSQYSTANLNSLTFVTDHYEAYRSLGASPTTTFYSPIYAEDSLPSNFEISVDVNTTTVYQEMLTIGNNHPSTYTGTTECGIVSTYSRYGLFKRLSGTGTFYTTSGHLSANTWYKFIVKVEGTSVTGKILNSQGTELHSATQTISDVQSWKKWNIIVGDGSHTLKWKNLKIKAL